MKKMNPGPSFILPILFAKGYCNLYVFIRGLIEMSMCQYHHCKYVCEHFYPTALKGCQGIVFTHGVRMGGKKIVRAVSQKL